VPEKRLLLLPVILVVILSWQFKFSCLAQSHERKNSTGVPTMKIDLTSSAFENGQTIPRQYTADGKDISPPLKWSAMPEQAKSLALICDDPDAPMGTWVHWVVYDLPTNISQLNEGVSIVPTLADGTKQGTNSFNKIGYGGPSPPPGKPHRYFFKLYALNVALNLKPGANAKEVEQSMQGHILATGQLMGTYGR